MEITYENSITVTDYNNLRTSAGWTALPEKQASAGLSNSDYVIAAKDEGKTVGMARVLTDGGCVAYILDVVVLPEYQGKGIGKIMMQRIMTFLQDRLDSGEICNLGLMAAKGKEGFYKNLGFGERPNDQHGAGMTMWMKREN